MQTFGIDKAKELLLEEGHIYLKYVRTFESGFIFANAMNICQPDHKQMLPEGETLISAAYLMVKKDDLNTDGWSMTLRIGPCDDDESILRELFYGG